MTVTNAFNSSSLCVVERSGTAMSENGSLQCKIGFCEQFDQSEFVVSELFYNTI